MVRIAGERADHGSTLIMLYIHCMVRITMAVITVRLPEDLRKRMHRLRRVNWSAVIRDSIEHRVRLEERSPERDWDRIRRAHRLAEEIFEENQRKYGHVNFNSAETIRYWRGREYRSTQSTRQSQ
jgi:predicted transcriptional regulator